jgi:membrane-associated protein
MASQHIGTRIFVTPLGLFMSWLALHTHLAYLVLFAGAFFEALIGPSFFIPGELFLLGGSILAGAGKLHIWLVLIVLYGGAILGDSASFFIGRYIGKSMFSVNNKFLTVKNYKKLEKGFEKYGLQSIFFARLIGPFSKIVPALAGMLEVPFGDFLLYNIPGVLVGCGEFIIVGYFFGDRYQLVLWLVERYSVIFFAATAILVVVFYQIKNVYFPKKEDSSVVENEPLDLEDDSV